MTFIIIYVQKLIVCIFNLCSHPSERHTAVDVNIKKMWKIIIRNGWRSRLRVSSTKQVSKSYSYACLSRHHHWSVHNMQICIWYNYLDSVDWALIIGSSVKYFCVLQRLPSSRVKSHPRRSQEPLHPEDLCFLIQILVSFRALKCWLPFMAVAQLTNSLVSSSMLICQSLPAKPLGLIH